MRTIGTWLQRLIEMLMALMLAVMVVAVFVNVALRYLGTLGFLVRAKQAGLIPQVGPLLDDLAAVDFWMSDSLRERILRAAGEL